MSSKVINFGDAKKTIERRKGQRRQNCEKAYWTNVRNIADSVSQTARIFHASPECVLNDVAASLMIEK